MEIPIGAEVHSTDGVYGRTTYVILNPTSEEVTHVVVQRLKKSPRKEYVVPIELITESSPQRIRLRCTDEELDKMNPFAEVEFIRSDIPHYLSESTMMHPFVVPEKQIVTEEHERIPPGELALRRGASVEAVDGFIGRVSEFLVDPVTSHITHLILREGHLWGQKEITIPVSQIDKISENGVHLKLDKNAVGKLPGIAVQRLWD